MDRTASRESRIERLCAERGMRMTGQRRIIAKVLSEADDHPDVEEVYRRASARDPRISLSTVYRTVRLFEGAGILERHEFGAGRRARYEPAGHGHHDHLINVDTGEVIEFKNEQIERLQEIVARDALTTVMVTHSMPQAVNLGDRLLMMHRGRIVHDFQGAEKGRLRVQDLLGRFEAVRNAELLDESAAEMLRRMYV